MSSGYGSTSAYAAACSASSPTCGPLPCDRTRWWSRATAASPGAADRTFARWFSAFIDSPRFSSAFPPRATTTRMTTSRVRSSSVAQRGDHDGLDGVEAVLRLVEDDRVLGLEHVVGDLQPVHAEALVDVLADLGPAVVEGRQAVHEPDLRVPGALDDRRVHLVGGQQLDPLLPDRLLLAHGDPDVGVEVVHAADSLVDVLGQRETCAGLLGDVVARLDQVVLGPELPRRAQPDVHPELAAADHQ